MPTQPQGKIKTLESTFRIVEALDQAGVETLPGLEERLALPTSTIYDHLQTLEHHGYVVETADGYRLGLKYLQRGARVRNRIGFYEAARPEMNKLAAATGERVNLVVEELGAGVFVDIIRGEEAVSQDITLGSRVELYCTSGGKAIMAHRPEEFVQDIIDRGLETKTANTATDPAELRDELATIKQQGYALDLEERHEGLHCVGAPIVHDGTAVGSVSISGPAGRNPEEHLRSELADQVTQTANVIELNSIFS